jgi:hypothetical protein
MEDYFPNYVKKGKESPFLAAIPGFADLLTLGK